MTFKEYIATRRITDTPQGDFTGDARRDKNLPDAKTWAELKSYLRWKTSDSDVLNAARQVWQGYVTKQRTQVQSV